MDSRERIKNLLNKDRGFENLTKPISKPKPKPKPKLKPKPKPKPVTKPITEKEEK